MILRLIVRIWAIIILIIAIIFLVGYLYNWVTLGTADSLQVEEAHPPRIFGYNRIRYCLKKGENWWHYYSFSWNFISEGGNLSMGF